MLPCRFQQLLDEPPRIVDVGRGGSGADGPERIGGRAHGRPQGVFGIAELVVWSNTGAPGSEYTVQESAHDSGGPAPSSMSSRVSWANSGTSPTAAAGLSGLVMMTASPEARASRSNCVPAASPRTSPGTGETTLIVPRKRPGTPREADTAGRPSAARSVCNNETVPASWTSGHGRPVSPAATASYAVTDCFGAQRDNASKTSSGAALPASQALAHKDSETLGHHMISECSCLVPQRPITRILAA